MLMTFPHPLQYPTGKRRVEPIGVTVFSVCMITSFAQVAVESIQSLFDKSLGPVDLPMTAAVAMAGTVVVKSMVWLTYRSFKSQSIQGEARIVLERECRQDEEQS